LIIFEALKLYLMNIRDGFWVLFLVLVAHSYLYSQTISPPPVQNPEELLGSQKAITTAVPFLAISPDARHAALGDAGVATSPDANSTYWNAGKLVFYDKAFGVSGSWTPWLGKIVNDMSIFYLTGFYKISKEQAINLSMKYFDLGDITFNTGPNPQDIIGEFHPREFAFDASYSRKLTENLGVGLTGRYIHSNLTGSFAGTNGASDAKPGNSVAADVGIYYTKQLLTARSSQISLGLQLSNIGAKLSYTDNANKNFLPTTLRLGGAFRKDLDIHNSLTFILDFSKLMVPSVDSLNRTKTMLSGMFSSFSDAPGGASEEFSEVMTSAGVEYLYKDFFAARLGYFLEAKDKGNRKYMTAGVGFKFNKFGIDLAYLVPTNQREHPLAETIRFTLHYVWDKSTVDEESVTD
jgi:hypothetical protein